MSDENKKEKKEFEDFEGNDYSFGNRRKDQGDEIVLDNERLFDMIYNLDNKVCERINDLSNTVNKIQQTLNNGLKDKATRNSKSISNLQSKVDDIYNMVNKMSGEKQGAKLFRKKLGWYIAILASILGAGSTILAILDKFPF